MVLLPEKEKPMLGNVLHGTDLKIKSSSIKVDPAIRPDSEQIAFGPQPATPDPNAHLPIGYKLNLEEIQERLSDDNHVIEGENLISMSPISNPRFQERMKPSWEQSLNAAFLQENDFVGAWQFLKRKSEQASFQDDPEWEITAGMIIGTPFEEAVELLTDVNSQEEFDFLNSWYTDELKQREILLASGGRGLAFSLLAGVATPLSLFSFGAGIRTGSMLKGGYVGMRAGLIGTGISEAFLQTNQGFRPAAESGFAIVAGTFLMGVVGSGAGALGKKAVFRGIDDIDQLIGDGVERAVQAVDGTIYGRNAVVDEKLHALQQLSVENREIPTLTMVRDIFLKHGDALDDSQISGRVTINGEVLISPADGINSENLLRGFDSTLAVTDENLDELITRIVKNHDDVDTRRSAIRQLETLILRVVGEEDIAAKAAEKEIRKTYEKFKKAIADKIQSGEIDPSDYDAKIKELDEALTEGLDAVKADRLLFNLIGDSPEIRVSWTAELEQFAKTVGQENPVSLVALSKYIKQLAAKSVSRLSPAEKKLKYLFDEVMDGERVVRSIEDRNTIERLKDGFLTGRSGVANDDFSSMFDGRNLPLNDSDRKLLAKVRQELIARKESAQFLQAEVAQGISDEVSKIPLREGALPEAESSLIAGLRKLTGKKAPDEGADALEDAWDAKLQSGDKAPDEGAAALKAQAEDVDQLELELRQMNGIQEELSKLLEKKPTARDLARINFLHFKYAGLTSESRINRLRQMFEDAGLDTKHIDNLEGRKIDEPEADGVDVDRLDNDAVERLRANDRDVNHENVCQ